MGSVGYDISVVPPTLSIRLLSFIFYPHKICLRLFLFRLPEFVPICGNWFVKCRRIEFVETDNRFITLYLLAFYVIFECVLNVFAEVTRFADRGFYDAWWNSTTWDQVPSQTHSLPPHSLLIRSQVKNPGFLMLVRQRME